MAAAAEVAHACLGNSLGVHYAVDCSALEVAAFVDAGVAHYIQGTDLVVVDA